MVQNRMAEGSCSWLLTAAVTHRCSHWPLPLLIAEEVIENHLAWLLVKERWGEEPKTPMDALTEESLLEQPQVPAWASWACRIWASVVRTGFGELAQRTTHCTACPMHAVRD